MSTELLSDIGLGMWGDGGQMEPDDSRDDEVVENLITAIRLGYTRIDTAEMYGGGYAEKLLGTALSDLSVDERTGLTIVSKVMRENQSYDGVRRACEASLVRTGLSRFGLYLLHHYPNPGIDPADTMRAMDWLVEQELVDAIGVSNLTPRRFDEIQWHTGNKLVCNQVELSLIERQADTTWGILDHAAEHGYDIDVWRPLKLGSLLQGEGGVMLQQMADWNDCTPAQLALAWVLRQPEIREQPDLRVTTIVKASGEQHLRENLEVVEIADRINLDDLRALGRDFPGQRLVSDVRLDYPADIAA